jgi:hypothetical protein
MLVTVRSLLNHGANPTLKDNRNRLPSEMLKKRTFRNLNKSMHLPGNGPRVKAALRRAQSKMIEQMLNQKIDDIALNGIQNQLDTFEFNPICENVDMNTLNLNS